MPTPEENKAHLRKMFEPFHEKDDHFLDWIHPDHEQPYPPLPPGTMQQGVREVWEAWSHSFSDFHFTIEQQIAEGDWVAGRYTLRGTHTGEFLGFAPTGNKFEITCLDMQRLKDGKVIENWWTADQLDVLMQLGLAHGPARPWGWITKR